MSQARIALLPDRGVVSVRGTDAASLLQGIITNDIDELDTTGSVLQPPAMHAGLLSPQGKILFDFLVIRMMPGPHAPPGDAFLLETARDKAADLVKRLTMYKLRADVTIEGTGDDFPVYALWGLPLKELSALPPIGFDVSPTHYPDPRAAGLGIRWLAWHSMQDRMLSGILRSGRAVEATAADYHAHRIGLGIAEGGRDYDFGDAFPHEANFDLDHGVSFEKGCYVGQEVVARMQHKTVVRKRVVRVTGASALPDTRPDIEAGGVVIGRLGSVYDRLGLAMLRLDRVLEFQAKGTPITAAGMALTVDPDALDRYRKSASATGQKPL